MKALILGFGLMFAGAVAVTLGLPLLIAAAGAPAVAQGGSGTPSALAVQEIPPFLLPRYEAAPACAGLPWQIVAAIGWVESRHGDGRINPTTGDTSPPIIGPALSGTGGTVAIPATPESIAFTGDPVWDHAVGPMQFLTSTFDAWAVLASGDALPNPNNAFDAIATAGRLLCDGQPQIESITDAIRRYNDSDAYVTELLAKAVAYGMTLGGSAAGEATVSGDVATVIAFAEAQLGKPYQWGATGPNAYDCSGLTQAAYAAAGIQIDRTSYDQATEGVAVNWLDAPIEAGDLIFTADGQGQPLGHVGVAIGGKQWIVAPYTGTVVQIDPIPFSTIEAIREIVNPDGGGQN